MADLNPFSKVLQKHAGRAKERVSEEKPASQPSVVNKNFNPKGESSAASGSKQVEKSVSSRGNVSFPLHSNLAELPNFDIVISKLILDAEMNYVASTETFEEQMAVFEKTSSQMADLENFIEGMGVVLTPEGYKASEGAEDQIAASKDARDQSAVSEEEDQIDISKAADDETTVSEDTAAAKKAESGGAADKKNVKGEAGSSYDKDQMSASGEVPSGHAADYMEASVSYDLPPPTAFSTVFRDEVRAKFGHLFVYGKKLEDTFGITDICDSALLETHNKLLFLLFTHKLRESTERQKIDPAPMMANALILELKRLYSLRYVFDLFLEGDTEDYKNLNPTYEETPRMMNATLILGFTMLAFANYVKRGRVHKKGMLKRQIEEIGIELDDDQHERPDHPLLKHLHCVKESLVEINRYIKVLHGALRCLNSSLIY